MKPLDVPQGAIEDDQGGDWDEDDDLCGDDLAFARWFRAFVHEHPDVWTLFAEHPFEDWARFGCMARQRMMLRLSQTELNRVAMGQTPDAWRHERPRLRIVS